MYTYNADDAVHPSFSHSVCNSPSLQVLLWGDQVQFFEVTLVPGSASISVSATNGTQQSNRSGADGTSTNNSSYKQQDESAKAWLGAESDFLCLDFTADLTADTTAASIFGK